VGLQGRANVDLFSADLIPHDLSCSAGINAQRTKAAGGPKFHSYALDRMMQ
jgi:hypothetical protein